MSDSTVNNSDLEELLLALGKADYVPPHGFKAKQVRKRMYKLWDRPDIEIAGWKFQEWDFGKGLLPTEARGLFTLGSNVVVRGYDKFFNLGEKSWTKWSALEQSTSGPYYVTSKENGCIVFISGLDDGTLIVTSKHSTGPMETSDTYSKNHSWASKQWIDKTLKAKGIEASELAKYLAANHLTAVGELCDDEFEEHVLAYKGKEAGVYIHGLNKNSAEFISLPFEDVTDFAIRFGFIPTKYLKFDKLDETRQFLEACESTGSWNGREIEGFVIRCQQATGDQDQKHTFFFKYKFEEPYLLFRTWRELTTKLIKANGDITAIKFTKRKALCLRYVEYCANQFKKNPQLQEDFLHKRGVVALREAFVQEMLPEGTDRAQWLKANVIDTSVDAKLVLIPVATIGCGKTTVARTLVNLFGWGHIQNDDLKGNKREKLINGTLSLLKSKPVVIMDRNNFKRSERQQIFQDIFAKEPPYDLGYVCLEFEQSKDVWTEAKKRVLERGNNHQTIKDCSANKLSSIMGVFTSGFQSVDSEHEPDSNFNTIIPLDSLKGSEYCVREVIKTIHKKYPRIIRKIPSDEEISRAFQQALSYKVTVVNPPGQKGQAPQTPKMRSIDYYGLALPTSVNVIDMLDALSNANPAFETSWKDFRECAVNKKDLFHVTLLHKHQARTNDQAKKQMKVWTKELAAKKNAEQPLERGVNVFEKTAVNLRLCKVCWNERVMAIAVEILSKEFLSFNEFPHITVALKADVQAVESNDMLNSDHQEVSLGVEVENCQLYAFAR